MNNSFYIFLIVFSFWACSGKGSEKQQSSRNSYSLGYNFEAPSQVHELPEELEELSGMAALNAHTLLLNEDENGNIYLFNLAEGSVEKELEFGEDGDYEGTAINGNTAYVVDSEGTIFEVREIDSEDPQVEEYKNKALKDCDVEGLHFLKDENSLLVACKEGTGEDKREIFRFSLESRSLDQEPYRTLSLKDIEDKLLQTDLDKVSVQIRKLLDSKGESGILFPSGIAIHPKTSDLYVLSAKSKLLVVYSAEGSLKEVVELRNELFLQPEAIAFTPNGDLYIGNEGSGGEPNILKFTYAQE